MGGGVGGGGVGWGGGWGVGWGVAEPFKGGSGGVEPPQVHAPTHPGTEIIRWSVPTAECTWCTTASNETFKHIVIFHGKIN